MMTRHGQTGKIESYTQEDDGAIICKACSRIIVSKENLVDGKNCPYCHNDVNVILVPDELIEPEGEDEDIAVEC